MKWILTTLILLLTLFAHAQNPNVFIGQREMTRIIAGDEYDEFYWFDANNTTLTSTNVTIPVTGTYRFDVSGYDVAGSPQIQLLIDGVGVGSVTVNTTNTTIFSLFLSSITAG